MTDFELHTPILFLIFNRPDTTTQVFEIIRRAKPLRLYVAADGPRENKLDESDRVEQTRQVVLDNIDWECEVYTLFRDVNLGCRQAVSGAIDWFFEYEEEGIILEDDCLPHPTFFRFCEELLEKYRDDERIMMISGTNYLLQLDVPESYVFSRYFAVWGWATWRRAWQKYDTNMTQWSQFKMQGQLNYIYAQSFMQKFLNKIFDLAYRQQIDTWDIQWFYSCLFNSGLSVVPKVNLISNIGTVGTHTSRCMESPVLPVFTLNIESLTHPQKIFANVLYDEAMFKVRIKPSMWSLVKRKVVSFNCWLKRLVETKSSSV